jgi:LysM repeat protein
MMTSVQSPGAQGMRRTLRCALLGALLLAAAAGCSSGSKLVDESNPFYLRGLRLRQENKYEEAAQAFAKCLRFSPASVKAELQLAMLFEDHLDDPARAVVHYRAYLQKAPAGESRDTVAKWLARAERSYLQQLMDRYPEDVDILMGRGATAPSAVSPRESALREQVVRLNAEVDGLRRELSLVHAALAAARGGGRASAVPGTSPAAAVAPAPAPVSSPAVPAPASTVPVPWPAAAHGTPAGASAPTAAPPLPPPEESGGFIPVRRLTPSAAAVPGTAAAAPAPTRYTVVAGDTLSAVARKSYGSASLWPLLQEANRELLQGGTALKPGMELLVPPKPPAAP